MAKKVVGLLKGVAYTGAAVGGLSVLSSADLVFAEELEETLTSGSSGTVELEITQEATSQSEAQVEQQNQAVGQSQGEQQVQVDQQTQIDQQTNTETNIELDENAFTVESATAAIEEAKAEKTAVEGTIAADTAEEQQAQADLAAAQTNLGQAIEDQGQLQSTISGYQQQIAPKVAEIESLQGEVASNQSQIDTATQERADAVATEQGKETELQNTQTAQETEQQEYDNSGYNQAGVAALEGSIATQTTAVLAERDNLLAQGVTYLQGQVGEDFYTDYTRPLALTMIKYNLLVNDQVTADDLANFGTSDSSAIRYSENFKGKSYENKHFCIRYVDKNGVLQEKYYDWVIADENGESIFKANSNDRSDANLTLMHGINVVEKTPIYKYYTEDENTLTYYKWEDLTAEEKSAVTTLKNQGKVKSVKINNVTYYVALRNESAGFDYGTNGEKKGDDFYKGTDFQADLSAHAQYIEDLAALSTKINTLTNEINGLNSDISGYDTTIANLTATIGDLNTQITNLQESIAPQVTAIAANQTLLDGVNTSIEEYNTQIATLIARIQELQTAIQTNTGTVADLNTKIQQLENILAKLKAAQASAAASGQGGQDDTVASSERYYRTAVVAAQTQTEAQAENQVAQQTVTIADTQAPAAAVASVQQVAANSDVISIEDVQVPLNVIDAELPTEDMGLATIPDEAVAKSGAVGLGMAGAAMHIGILPTIGGLTTIIGCKKTNDENKARR
ncbi:hypothetical protein SAMN02910298_01688 [Pseudobutyrivibrio sp. YE44]|uniref:hypothetical protein n=1 Tax=Pseudobutyrivibrio sp. YE44 TaxID=1520802 RepID=UPI00088B336E|nr:hypothetical protein [Pseudobutyrivibrio sp. YE44]SDB34626.1 hypothetical protein SAMN02910298_01688 [Pseudobutyrivibrio sp. YE44]